MNHESVSFVFGWESIAATIGSVVLDTMLASANRTMYAAKQPTVVRINRERILVITALSLDAA